MKTLSLAIALSITALSTSAQTTEDSVKATVNQLFTGMKNSDPSLILASFSDSALLQTISADKDGVISVKSQPVAGFATSISKQPKGALDEQIQFGSIKIDGDLASVWTPYKFYFSEKFSHCGVNSFQLVRLKGSWKIQYIIDTRRRTGCE